MSKKSPQKHVQRFERIHLLSMRSWSEAFCALANIGVDNTLQLSLTCAPKLRQAATRDLRRSMIVGKRADNLG